MIIGITGGTGCGKTTLLRQIQARGGMILDCDEIYHGLLRSDRQMLTDIAERFPETMENGVLDRKKLGGMVFADPEALLDLNRITHSAVRAEVLRRLESAPRLTAIDAIALFEGGLAELCDVTVAVTAPVESRVARLMCRDGISEEYARKRIAAQKPDGFFAEACDVVLENTGDLPSFQEKCRELLEQLCK